jgi:hypothetical protein
MTTKERMIKPIAWYDPTNGTVSTDKDSPLFTPLGQVLPLYTQRTWVGLTDKERREVWDSCERQTPTTYVKAIEAKLKEKNTWN